MGFRHECNFILYSLRFFNVGFLRYSASGAQNALASEVGIEHNKLPPRVKMALFGLMISLAGTATSAATIPPGVSVWGWLEADPHLSNAPPHASHLGTSSFSSPLGTNPDSNSFGIGAIFPSPTTYGVFGQTGDQVSVHYDAGAIYSQQAPPFDFLSTRAAVTWRGGIWVSTPFRFAPLRLKFEWLQTGLLNASGPSAEASWGGWGYCTAAVTCDRNWPLSVYFSDKSTSAGTDVSANDTKFFEILVPSYPSSSFDSRVLEFYISGETIGRASGDMASFLGDGSLTLVDIQVVPLPPGLLLLGSALVAMGCVRRSPRRKGALLGRVVLK